MGDFTRKVHRYSSRYALSPPDRWRLLGLGGLIMRLDLLAQRDDRLGRLAGRVLDAHRTIELRHRIRGPSKALTISLPLDPHAFLSFYEVFLAGEYEFAGALDRVETFVDLGGNVGMASLYLSATFSPATALIVEANPALIDGLRRRVKGVAPHVVVHNAAVLGRPAEDTALSIDRDHRLSFVRTEWGTSSPVTVPALTLTQLLDANGITSADLLKMDIEGAEYDVIDHDADALRRFRYLAVEVHGERVRRDGFLHRLEELGFEVTAKENTEKSVTVLAHSS